MAVDMLLKIDGIEGESLISDHENEIDIDAWNWGLSQSGTTHRGMGSGSGKVDVQDITFMKKVDKSSPRLIQECCSGKHIKEATLTVRKAGDDPIDYVKIRFETLIISSYQTGGSAGGDDTVTETVTINFGKFNFIYTPQNNETGAGEGTVEAGFDIMTNRKM